MRDLAIDIAERHLQRWKLRNDNFMGASCPFHGEDRNPSFWIDLETGRWGCFACSAGGKDLGYLLQALGDPAKAAMAKVEVARQEKKKLEDITRAVAEAKSRETFVGQHVLPDNLLGVYNWTPTALLEQGFTAQILEEHEVGYDKVNSRITFPIRDIEGNLIGISGRRDSYSSGPKYKVYKGWHLNSEGQRVPGELGEWFPDYDSAGMKDHLYRGDKVLNRVYHDPEEDQLIIVEGYKACLWLVQNGYHNTVALMGASMSQKQERMIANLGVDTWVFLDNNDAGRSGSARVCNRLAKQGVPVYEVQYPDDAEDEAQPDDLVGEALDDALSCALRII